MILTSTSPSKDQTISFTKCVAANICIIACKQSTTGAMLSQTIDGGA